MSNRNIRRLQSAMYGMLAIVVIIVGVIAFCSWGDAAQIEQGQVLLIKKAEPWWKFSSFKISSWVFSKEPTKLIKGPATVPITKDDEFFLVKKEATISVMLAIQKPRGLLNLLSATEARELKATLQIDLMPESIERLCGSKPSMEFLAGLKADVAALQQRAELFHASEEKLPTLLQEGLKTVLDKYKIVLRVCTIDANKTSDKAALEAEAVLPFLQQELVASLQQTKAFDPDSFRSNCIILAVIIGGLLIICLLLKFGGGIDIPLPFFF